MILLIETKFNITDNCYHLTELLDFLVSQGMQPPSYVNGYFTAPYLGCDSADVEWVEETVNDWEPE